MTNADINALNQQYGQADRILFATDDHDQAYVELTRAAATARIYLQGAHVTQCRLDNSGDLLWLSKQSLYSPGKAIRGGIPLCWPWFGPHPHDSALPQHGHARISTFDVVASRADADESALSLHFEAEVGDDAATNRSRLGLRVDIRLSTSLFLEITTTNQGDHPVPVSAALHNYFRVEDLGQTALPALTGLSYNDKLRQDSRYTQTVALDCQQPMDRVYRDPPDTLILEDGRRRVLLQSWGNSSLVVWNPGADKASAMADFDDLGYLQMLCVEPAIDATTRLNLMPGASHQLGQRLSINLN